LKQLHSITLAKLASDPFLRSQVFWAAGEKEAAPRAAASQRARTGKAGEVGDHLAEAIESEREVVRG
jgi:hypothetical protein